MIVIRKTIGMFLAALALSAAFLFSTDAHAAGEPTAAGAVTTSAGRLTVRSAPDTASAAVSYLNKGSYVSLIQRSGNWWQVEYAQGQRGWCHSNYITPVQGSPAVVQTGSGNLNVRSGGGTGYPITAKLPRGTAVLELSRSNGWSRILYHGTKTGYVSSQYLSGTGSAPVGYGGVSLSVPSYKQTDSRWAHVAIGSSGGTMGKIGCATTAIAMVESYRTGSTITPDAMSRKLSYTASGSVYWPGHYTTVTDSQGYLSKIYSLLQQGKPVLFGAKNSYGGQHWVVITGYTGGSSLTTGGFTIHDPGSNTRTNLAQFQSAYPQFYKYFHY